MNNETKKVTQIRLQVFLVVAFLTLYFYFILLSEAPTLSTQSAVS